VDVHIISPIFQKYVNKRFMTILLLAVLYFNAFSFQVASTVLVEVSSNPLHPAVLDITVDLERSRPHLTKE
jgi:hypothetical protein